jgi:hypothetical protein
MHPTTGCKFDARREVHNKLLDLPDELQDDVAQKVVDCFRK